MPEPIADPSTIEGFLGWVILLAAALTAVGVLLKYTLRGVKRLWRFVELSIRAFEIIEKELSPNGGGSTYDLVRADHSRLAEVERQVGVLHEQGQVLTGYAERNKGLAEAAHGAAEVAADKAEAGRAVAERIEEQRRRDVVDIRQAMVDMRGEIAQDAADRTASAFELLEERTRNRPDGAIDLRGEVLPHVHQLPTRTDPTLTGGPVEPEG